MPAPDPDADPTTKPYRVLGIDPTSGPHEFVLKEEIEARAKELLNKHKDDKTHYVNIQKALKRVREIHPDRSRSGVWRVPLTIDTEQSHIEVNETVTVTVRTVFGDAISGATVSIDGQRKGRTDKNGETSFSITDTGTVELVASKGKEQNKEYVDGEESVEVKKKEVQLVFADVPDSCVTGDEVTVKIEDTDGKPKRGVTVTPEEGSPDETDKDGEATVDVRGSGGITLRAEKDASRLRKYRSAEATISVSKKTVKLQIADYPATSEVGKRAVFRVTNADGAPVKGATVEVANHSSTTNPNGQATIRLSPATVGETTVKATKQNSTEVAYTDDTATVTVDEREVDLTIDQYPREATIGTETTFRVVDSDGDPVPKVTVRTKSTSAQTDDNGRASLTFDSDDVGTATVNAQKQDRQGIRYHHDTVSVSVSKQQTSLDIRLETSTPMVENEVDFRVLDDTGSPVKGATVRTQSQQATTGKSGDASLTPQRGGKLTVVAEKASSERVTYASNRIEIDVERETERLDLTPPETNIERGNEVTFTVTNDDGVAVEGATVDGESADSETSDRFGEATLTFTAVGRKRVTASKPATETVEFVEDSVSVQVSEPPKTVELVDTPSSVSVGDRVEFQVVDHKGDPLSDAVVKAISQNENNTKTTNPSGKASFTFKESGFYQISASKEGFDVYDEHNLRVKG